MDFIIFFVVLEFIIYNLTTHIKGNIYFLIIKYSINKLDDNFRITNHNSSPLKFVESIITTLYF